MAKPATEFGTFTRQAAIRVGARVEWFIGPRRLRRTGTVLTVYGDGRLQVRADGMKTAPVRTVHPACSPAVI